MSTSIYPSITGAASSIGNSITWNNITGTSTITASAPSISSYPMYGAMTTHISMPLRVDGDAIIKGDITFGGTSLTGRLDKIEQRLGIIRHNEELEEQWKELKELGDRYRELEKELIEKEKTWDILKK